MEKLPKVEAAKALMTEALRWSVMKWLREKKTVRKVADEANACLDELDRSVRHRWPVTKSQEAIKNIRAADEEAYAARMDAERTFDLAEKKLSTAIAREGCRKAIHSWELHERAIRMAVALIDSR